MSTVDKNLKNAEKKNDTAAEIIEVSEAELDNVTGGAKPDKNKNKNKNKDKGVVSFLPGVGLIPGEVERL